MSGDEAAWDGTAQEYRVRSRFYAPPPEFEGCFTTFYKLELSVEDNGTLLDYLQPEWANIRFFAGCSPNAEIPGSSAVSDARFTATGPSSLPVKFELGPTRLWGIGFLPLGWARFMDVEAQSVANLVTDGEAHPAFARFASLCDKLCDEKLSDEEQHQAILAALRDLMKPSRDEQKILRVHRALFDSGVTNVSEFADNVGMSTRTLERICRRYFGFSPKLLMRRQRFMRSLTSYMLHQGKKWTEVMDAHYHDQAQFTREFHEFMTMNPSEYAALDHPILKSFMEARARIWGSAAQTLDQPD